MRIFGIWHKKVGGFFGGPVFGYVMIVIAIIIIAVAIAIGCGKPEIHKYLDTTGEMPYKTESPDYPAECPRCKRLCPEMKKPCCWCGNEKMRRPDAGID